MRFLVAALRECKRVYPHLTSVSMRIFQDAKDARDVVDAARVTTAAWVW